MVLDGVPVEEWSWTPHDPGAALFQRDRTPPLCQNAAQTNYRPSGRRQKVVLIFEAGILSLPLIEALRARGLRYFYLDFRELMERGTLQMRVAHGEPSALQLGPARLLLRDVAAVIWDPPLPVVNHIPERPASQHLHRHRWMQALRDLKALLPPDVLWLPSHPLNGSAEWQNKLSELVLAERAGLRVPETLCTNDPAAAAAFIARCGGRALFRDFSHAKTRFRTAFAAAAPRRLERVERAPCGFQRYVEKEYEVRAVVIGDRVFACRIDSQAPGASRAAKLDWRVYDNRNVRWERMRLPRRTERALVSLLRTLDLAWGSADLVKSVDGELYFLEVNRPGASYWLLPFVGLDVPAEMAAYLHDALRSSRRGTGGSGVIPSAGAQRRSEESPSG